jgi:hypothetical protein
MRGRNFPFSVGFLGQGAPIPDGSAKHGGRVNINDCVFLEVYNDGCMVRTTINEKGALLWGLGFSFTQAHFLSFN